ncbi:MAG: hypothetical protein C4534_00510 [Gaiellales bacterium]|nr:MAG: hypothetical protein C4534_00510 [Gaiellales bacterium]
MANTGQMLLVLGAMVLFSLMLPSLNESILYSDRTMIATKAEMAAVSLAQRILAEAGTKAFDEACITGAPIFPSQMTPTGSLGAESGESYPNYDDVDDFRSLNLADSTTLPSVLLNVTASVVYVNPSSPSGTSASSTFVKRLRVTVSGPFLVNPASGMAMQIALEQLYSYF